MDRIATDIIGELPLTENGKRYILVVSDHFTRWTEAFPMSNTEARTIAKSNHSVWRSLYNTFIPRASILE